MDVIKEDPESGCYIVTDDFGINVMYDAAMGDMRAVEQELIKIVSFYINKMEPMIDTDLRNVFPCVDRLSMIHEIIECEQQYQRTKLILCMTYLECYEHTCDVLELQRIVQIIVDLMARRPRMNLAANHFRDSYRAETEVFELSIKIMREFISMQMKMEF